MLDGVVLPDTPPGEILPREDTGALAHLRGSVVTVNKVHRAWTE